MDRPTFSELKLHLEKLLESLPASKEPDDIFYINTNLLEETMEELTEDSEFPRIDTDLDPNYIIETCCPRPDTTVVTVVDVHESNGMGERYILRGVSEDHINTLARPEDEGSALLQYAPSQNGTLWSQASTLPLGTRLANELRYADDSLEDCEIILL